jgi:hypothetical protein
MTSSILGKTRSEKIRNILGLIILAAFFLYKTDLIKLDVAHIHNEPVSAAELDFKNSDDLLAAVASYQVDMGAVEREAQKAGVSLADFEKSVKMNIAVPKSDSHPTEFNLEFESDIKDKDLTPVFKYIAADMKAFLSHKQSGAQ